MSTSPLSPEDIRAAAEVRQELGPEYNDAVVASFLAKVDREIAARVEARLADVTRAEPPKQRNRHTFAKGIAVGAGTVALVIAVGAGVGRSTQSAAAHPAPGSHAVKPQLPAPAAPKAPAAP